jgi:Zn-dependent protease
MRDPFQWSIGLGCWRGLTVRLHAFFLVFAAAAAYLLWPSSLTDVSGQSEHPLTAAGNVIGIVAAAISALFLSVLVHELAHWWVARMARVEPRVIVLGPLSGLSEWPSAASPRWELAIGSAGPAANLLLATLLIGAMRWFQPELSVLSLINPFEPVHVEQPFSFVLAIAIWLNCLLVLLNLLPGYPFDGGRVTRSAMRVVLPNLSERRVVEWNFWVTVGMSVLVATVALVLWKHGTQSDTISRTWLALLLLAVVLLISARRDALAFGVMLAAPMARNELAIGRGATGEPRMNRPECLDEQVWGTDEDAQDFDDEDEPFVDEDQTEEADDDELTPLGPLAADTEEALEEQRLDAILSRLYSQGIDSLSADDRAWLQRASARYRSRLGRRSEIGRRD